MNGDVIAACATTRETRARETTNATLHDLDTHLPAVLAQRDPATTRAYLDAHAAILTALETP